MVGDQLAIGAPFFDRVRELVGVLGGNGGIGRKIGVGHVRAVPDFDR
jgi:hypothetical protein